MIGWYRTARQLGHAWHCAALQALVARCTAAMRDAGWGD